MRGASTSLALLSKNPPVVVASIRHAVLDKLRSFGFDINLNEYVVVTFSVGRRATKGTTRSIPSHAEPCTNHSKFEIII